MIRVANVIYAVNDNNNKDDDSPVGRGNDVNEKHKSFPPSYNDEDRSHDWNTLY